MASGRAPHGDGADIARAEQRRRRERAEQERRHLEVCGHASGRPRDALYLSGDTIALPATMVAKVGGVFGL